MTCSIAKRGRRKEAGRVAGAGPCCRLERRWVPAVSQPSERGKARGWAAGGGGNWAAPLGQGERERGERELGLGFWPSRDQVSHLSFFLFFSFLFQNLFPIKL